MEITVIVFERVFDFFFFFFFFLFFNFRSILGLVRSGSVHFYLCTLLLDLNVCSSVSTSLFCVRVFLFWVIWMNLAY